MDSISQAVLGACIGELTLGKKLGNKAQLIGALAGTIPDLDVLANLFTTDEIVRLQIHRSWTHSMFIHFVLAWLFALLSARWSKKKEVSFQRWYWFWFLGFFTHAILDCFTTYGTQLLLPFSNVLVGFNNIAVADPFWTIPFLVLLAVSLFIRNTNPWRLRFAWTGMSWALIYLAWTFTNKYEVHQRFSNALRDQNISANEISTTPAILNNWLWSCIATTQDTLYVAETTLWNEQSSITFSRYPRNLNLLQTHPKQHDVDVLNWFGQGKTIAQLNSDTLRFYAVKWGRFSYEYEDPERAFGIYWILAQDGKSFPTHQVQPQMNQAAFGKMWDVLLARIRGEKVH